MTADEFKDFLTATGTALKKKQESLQASYGLGDFAEFYFDQPSGALQFKDDQGNVAVEAAVTPIGSFSRNGETWLWAWANESIAEPLRSKATKIKELLTVTGIKSFSRPNWRANEVVAWELAAMGVHILNSLGCFRMPLGALDFFVAIDSIKLAK